MKSKTTRIVRLAGIFFACFFLLGVVSCGSKVNKKELDKKIEKLMESDEMPEFTDAEYQFMVDYLTDNYEEIKKMNLDDPNAEVLTSYMMILADANYEGKLSKETKKKFERLNEKMKSSEEYNTYKENEKAIMDALENANIDWDQTFEESETTDD